MKLLGAVLLGCLLCVDAWAHDLWLEHDGPALVLYRGHAHSGHGGDARMPYDPATVLRVDCVDASGDRETPGTDRGYPLRIESPCAVTFVLVSSGYWTKTPYGTQNVPRTGIEHVVDSWQSFESVKYVDEWSEALSRALTSDLEVTPLVAPLRLTPGDKLRLRVTLHGEPLAGAVVSYDGSPRGASGEDGRINIRVRHGGFQFIQASFREAAPSDSADAVIHTTALVFEVPQ
jgi:nickel transport protein